MCRRIQCKRCTKAVHLAFWHVRRCKNTTETYPRSLDVNAHSWEDCSRSCQTVEDKDVQRLRRSCDVTECAMWSVAKACEDGCAAPHLFKAFILALSRRSVELANTPREVHWTSTCMARCHPHLCLLMASLLSLVAIAAR